MTDHLIHELRAESERFTLSVDERDLLRTQLDQYVTQELSAAVALDVPRRRARLRRPRVALGAALAGAVAVAVAVAMWPGDASRGPASVLAPTPAAAALQQAADAAGQADWTPLGPGEYHHLAFTSFTPDTDALGIDPDEPQDPGAGAGEGNRGWETWVSGDGAGQSLITMGAIDPNRFPVLHRDDAGNVRSTGGNTTPPKKPITTTRSLTLANHVTLFEWDTPFSQRQVNWYRQQDGYELGSDFEQSNRVEEGGWTNTRMWWGIDQTDLKALPDGGPELEHTLLEVVDRFVDSYAGLGELPTGAFGRTAAQLEEEERIRSVVHLLGAAPLSPNARRALFEWLARQPGAVLDGDAVDGSGRSGTSITFSKVYDEQVPARTITGAQLGAEAEAAGVGRVRVSNADEEIDVPAHREYRRWTVRVIVDTDRGELLEETSYMLQTSPDGFAPELVRYRPDGAAKMRNNGGAGAVATSIGARRYEVRERVTEIVPHSPVCAAAPKVCKVPAGPPGKPPR